MNVEISEKQYDGIYKCYKGNEIKTNIALYNSALISSAEQSEDIKFIVYSDDNGLQDNKEYCMGEQKEYQIGVWGQRYKRHLKSNHRVIYYNYLTSGRLYEHLAEVDTRAEVMFHELVKTLAEKENVTEKLKAENTLLWIRKMNNIRNRATEIVNVEVIYV